jgi:hypothetical protein
MQNVSSKSLKKIGASVLFGALICGGTGCATTINLSAPTTLAQPSVTTLQTGTTV